MNPEAPWIVRAARSYADWLAGITWKRFLLLALLALIASGILAELPPFSLRWGADRTEVRPASARAPRGDGRHYEVTIDERGVRIVPRAASAASAASAPPARPDGAAAGDDDEDDDSSAAAAPSVRITVPPGAAADTVREAIDEAKREIEAELGRRTRVVTVPAFRLGDLLPELTMVMILLSAIVKIMGAGRVRAEARADSEALKRQVVEARLAAMQAQVEPHFLFNTLASIDHLIETDPPRASRMQKNLIALLRASMPTLREAGNGQPRALGRELDIILPYLEILKVRMEDRLATEIAVPDGLRSADFPPMVLQGLVENAIKHGLEPKPEGGTLAVRAAVEHGRLVVTVADTGLGFGRAATAGTGVGLANIRERLQLLYGAKAELHVDANPGGGTVVRVIVPYQAAAPTIA